MSKHFFQRYVMLLLILAGFTHLQSPLRAESPNDILIIANRHLSSSEISLADVNRIFRKEMTSFHGSKLQVIHARKGSELRKQFVNKVLGISESAEQKFWLDMQVRKGIRPPIELNDTVRAVFSVPGAISYCFRRDFNPATAKIILSI